MTKASYQSPPTWACSAAGWYRTAISSASGVEAWVSAMRELVPPYRTQHLVANEAALRAGFDAGPANAAPAWEGVAA